MTVTLGTQGEIENNVAVFVRSISLIVVVVVVVVIVSGFALRGVDGSGGYSYPITADVVSSFSAVHSDYPATDIFAKCGVSVVAPVSGLVDGLRRSDLWNKKTDDPWFRGGTGCPPRA